MAAQVIQMSSPTPGASGRRIAKRFRCRRSGIGNPPHNSVRARVTYLEEELARLKSRDEQGDTGQHRKQELGREPKAQKASLCECPRGCTQQLYKDDYGGHCDFCFCETFPQPACDCDYSCPCHRYDPPEDTEGAFEERADQRILKELRRIDEERKAGSRSGKQSES